MGRILVLVLADNGCRRSHSPAVLFVSHDTVGKQTCFPSVPKPWCLGTGTMSVLESRTDPGMTQGPYALSNPLPETVAQSLVDQRFPIKIAMFGVSTTFSVKHTGLLAIWISFETSKRWLRTSFKVSGVDSRVDWKPPARQGLFTDCIIFLCIPRNILLMFINKFLCTWARDRNNKERSLWSFPDMFPTRPSEPLDEFRIVFFRCWRIERQGQEEGEVTCSQAACCRRCTCYSDWIMVGVCVSTLLDGFLMTVPNIHSWVASRSRNLRKPKKDKPIAIEDKKKKKKGLAAWPPHLSWQWLMLSGKT